MTRFARAKGSKSSNSKTPEDSSDWGELKKDLQEKSFLKKTKRDEEMEVTLRKSKKSEPEGEAQWADFGSFNDKTAFQSENEVQQKKRKNSDVFEEEPIHESGASKNKKKSKKQKDQNIGEDIVIGDTDHDVSKKPADSNSINPKKTFKKGANQKQNRWAANQEERSTVKINGIQIEVTKFDGFFVKSEDAQRLVALRKRMIKEGIPREEINKVMKLERRKAEKAFAKEKKKVCFQCRKPGHKLSECPQNGTQLGGAAGEDDGATGLCYKCGSTEHTHFECKVQKAGAYRFAKCFICKEQGHISSQCPDNPKGLYPRGGGCNICGEVTHLKKDCPQLTKTREESIVTLDTLGSSGAIEDLDGNASKNVARGKTSRKKVIKF